MRAGRWRTEGRPRLKTRVALNDARSRERQVASSLASSDTIASACRRCESAQACARRCPGGISTGAKTSPRAVALRVNSSRNNQLIPQMSRVVDGGMIGQAGYLERKFADVDAQLAGHRSDGGHE